MEQSFADFIGCPVPRIRIVDIGAMSEGADRYHPLVAAGLAEVTGFEPHPARMPERVPAFFIKFLTQRGDLVADPFAGSNTTGAVAEQLERKWVAVELNKEYLKASKGRFPKNGKLKK